MSDYGKNQQYIYDAEATRSNQLPTYSAVAQPSYAPHYPDAPARLSHGSDSADMPYISNATYQSRGASEHQVETSFIDASSRHSASTAPDAQVTAPIAPSQGTAGSILSLQLRTNHDLATDQHTFALMFGTRKCVGALQKVEYDDEWYNYVLNVEVPPFPLTNSWNPTMMLKLQMEDKMGNLKSQSDAGTFTFTDMSPNFTYPSSPDYNRKRKRSHVQDDAQPYPDPQAKRIHTARFQAKPPSMSGAYSGAQISPLPAQSALSHAYPSTTGYDFARQPAYAAQPVHKAAYSLPSAMGMAQGDYKLPQVSPSMQSYASYGAMAHPNRTSVAVPAGPSVLPSPAALAAPVLVRATTLPQAASLSSAQPFNPYSMYQTKAMLKIDGDLDKMSEDWSPGELEAKRRLVEFKRSQHGSTITTRFAPITPEDRPARSICVSCIWWAEKDECFITSVDTIYLLEQLVNVRFTVEEKNRIRRNLEGFRPLTVSKAKQDSEEFFKVIMAFPNPKPRNIEKDVKVFPWKILSHALKKIISKYSASYSSTAGLGSLPMASTSSYLPNALSQAALDAHREVSPQSVTASTASNAYTPLLTSSSLSPHTKVSAGLERSAGHGVPLSQRRQSGQGMTQWGPPTHQMPSYTNAPFQPGRGSWDYGYLNASTPAGQATMAQTLQMPHPDMKSDMSQLPAGHGYQAYGEHTTRV